MLDWLVVGGGIHGTFHSLALTARLGWARDRVRVVDPHADPLAVWTRQTTNTRMAFLRSSFVHHLALDPYDLRRYARTRAAIASGQARFAAPFHRPAYALFQAHARATVEANGLDALRRQARATVEANGLDALRRQARATGLARTARGWRVETSGGALKARRVLLALSHTEAPAWPAWAAGARMAADRLPAR